MIDIACDACGKRYRIDEAKMKAETAKVKCKTCGHVITVSRPQPAGEPPPAVAFDLPPAPVEAAAPEPPPRPPSTADKRPATDRLSATSVADASPDDTAAPRAFGEPRKVRFGLFGKIIIVMLLVSILPFGILWFLTFRETNERIRGDSEALMVQTAKGLGDQIEGWINGNFSTLRMAAALPEVPVEARLRLLELAQRHGLFRAASFTTEELPALRDSGRLGGIDLLALNIDEARVT